MSITFINCLSKTIQVQKTASQKLHNLDYWSENSGVDKEKYIHKEEVDYDEWRDCHVANEFLAKGIIFILVNALIQSLHLKSNEWNMTNEKWADDGKDVDCKPHVVS
jgi:hypothetical protein